MLSIAVSRLVKSRTLHLIAALREPPDISFYIRSNLYNEVIRCNYANVDLNRKGGIHRFRLETKVCKGIVKSETFTRVDFLYKRAFVQPVGILNKLKAIPRFFVLKRGSTRRVISLSAIISSLRFGFMKTSLLRPACSKNEEV